MTDSNDNFLKWVLEKEQALISEYEQHGFISVFARDFIEASLKKNALNIDGIKDSIEHNETAVKVVERISGGTTTEDRKTFRIVLAENNKRLEELDNCQLVLERMKDFVNSKTKKCEGQWGGCDKVGLDPHTCPFASDIDDDNKLCNCCENCQDSCHNNI